MGSNGASWVDQWGTSGGYGAENDGNKSKNNKSSGGGKNKKLEEMKVAASTGFDKAAVGAKKVAAVGYEKTKVAATVGAKKVKSGTVLGFKWVKAQYQKRSSSSK